jgi:hypothetical protein
MDTKAAPVMPESAVKNLGTRKQMPVHAHGSLWIPRLLPVMAESALKKFLGIGAREWDSPRHRAGD